MDARKSAELLRIYTLEHGKEMSPDDLDAHTTAIETINTFLCVQHQWELMRREFERTGGLAPAFPGSPA